MLFRSARSLLATDAATQIQLANQIVAKRMSVREAEKLVAKTTAEQTGTPKSREKPEKSRDIKRLEEEIADLLATQVVLKMGQRGKGQLIIDFADLDTLDGILLKIRGQ